MNQTKWHLWESLAVDEIGVSGIMARFTVKELREILLQLGATVKHPGQRGIKTALASEVLIAWMDRR